MERRMSDRQSEIVTALQKGERKRHLGRWLGLLVLLAALAGGAWWYLAGIGGSGAVSYRTAPVSRGNLEVTVTATGTIEPQSVVEISSELSGTLKAVNVGFNAEVHAGEVLAELDTTKLEAQLEVSRASQAAAGAAVAAAKATLDEANVNAATAQNLFDRGVGTQSSLDAAKATLARAQAAHDQALANRDLALANLKAQQAELEKACICSPIDGVVLDVAAEKGQIVAASLSAPTLFTIAEDLSRMELQVDVAEADIGRIAAGDRATFTVEAYDNRSFSAEITQVRYASEVTEGLVTYKAILAVDNPDLALRPGMTAVADIVVAEEKDVLMVPNAALRYVDPSASQPAPSNGEEEDNRGGLFGLIMRGHPNGAPATADGKSVWVLRAGVPVQVAVTPGETDGARTAVSSEGLAEGDQVITARITGG
jgi:HlyD family secretion protein